MKKVFNYDNDSKTAVFKLFEKGKVFVGKAKPAEEDKEIASQLTGLTIAEYKARIEREKAKTSYWKARVERLKKDLAEAEKYQRLHSEKFASLNAKLTSYKKQKDTFHRRFNSIKAKEEVMNKNDES